MWDNLTAWQPQRQPQATVQGENAIEAQGNLTASRTRYLVQNGDTLESIASNQLGAARLAGLLITINRGIIDFVVVNGKTVPSIRATQVIILPSASELAIHKKQYFTKHSLHPEAPDTVPWTRDNSTGSADKSGDTNDLSFSPTTFNHAAPRTVTRATAADTPQAQAQALRPRRRHHQVLAGDTLQSIALHDHLMADVDSWILVAKLNNLITTVDVLGKPLAKLLPGQFLLLPDEDEVEQYKLISKLMQIAELTGKKDPDLQFRFQRETAFRAKTFIHRLSNMCRIQLAD